MSISSLNNAIAAYKSAAQSVTEGQAQTQNTAAAAQGGTFGDMVRESLETAVDMGYKAEEMSLKGIAGEADMRDVVLAVNNAEHALNTVVAVRDKVVAAYQDILKMPI